MSLLIKWAETFEKQAADNNGFGTWMDGPDWLAIANDMRIDADEYVCHDVSKTLGRWTCSECGKSISVALTDEPPRYCAGCGRKVVDA